MLTSLLMGTVAAPAMAGYGDAFDGLPTYADRAIFHWTNAVRVDPTAFDYPCSTFGFAANEQSPQIPLYLNDGLLMAAHAHSTDMEATGDLSHTSSDGTSMATRVGMFYQGGAVGENIAWNYPSAYAVVVDGWMCSDGHRANMMSSGAPYNELGTSVVGAYWTQNFGLGNAPSRSTVLGFHEPQTPIDVAQMSLTVFADASPDRVAVNLNGSQTRLRVDYGIERQGVWSAEVDVGPEPCQRYHFIVEINGVSETWPDTGSYGWGDCDFDDHDAQWFASQWSPSPDATADGNAETWPTDGSELLECGCSSAVSFRGMWPAWLAVLALMRRRTESPCPSNCTESPIAQP